MQESRFRYLATCIQLCCLWLAASSARADDVADEADLHFNLGTERYEQKDYNGALSHFLVSNRLARNRNVLFNIALCYERLAQLPEAYRYYQRSLEGETDDTVIARIQIALARLAPQVPLLHIVTDPPGAHLFIDRRDLGERGTAPQTMALPPGTYRVFAELEGYEVAEGEPVELVVGVERTVSLQLRRIVGTIRIPGPAGASARLDADNTPELCQAPCDTQAPPGQHTLILSKEGFRTARVPIWVEASTTSPILVDLVAESGSLIVNADERGAALEVDGALRGSIPATLDLPAGAHRIRVSLRGFQPVERDVVIRPNEPNRTDIQLVFAESARGMESVDTMLDQFAPARPRVEAEGPGSTLEKGSLSKPAAQPPRRKRARLGLAAGSAGAVALLAVFALNRKKPSTTSIAEAGAHGEEAQAPPASLSGSPAAEVVTARKTELSSHPPRAAGDSMTDDIGPDAGVTAVAGQRSTKQQGLVDSRPVRAAPRGAVPPNASVPRQEAPPDFEALRRKR